MLGFKNFQADLHSSEDISNWKPKHGTQLGSNPGGIHVSPEGEHHYVKFYRNPEQAKAEVATARVYEHLGVSTLKPRLVNYRGHIGVASAWRHDLQDVHPHEYNNPSESMKHDLAKHYVAGVLTKNWDTVGNEFDNVKRGSNGKLVSLDQGGALHFRAMGGPKAYTPDIAEHKTYHDGGLNPYSKHAFKTLTTPHLHAALQGMSGASHEHISDVFHSSGLKNPQHFADTFAKRRELLSSALSSSDQKR